MSDSVTVQPEASLLSVFSPVSFFRLQFKLLQLPLLLFVKALVLVAWTLDNFLLFCGQPPPSKVDRRKMQQAQAALNVMAQREDGYRSKIKALQETTDAKKRELRALKAQAKTAQANGIERSGSEASLPVTAVEPSSWGFHATFIIIGVLPAFWFLQQHNTPTISRKIVWSVISPEGVLYVWSMLGGGSKATPMALQACSLFLSGFIFCHWVHSNV